MNTTHASRRQPQAFTLVELTLVILVMMTLIGTGLMVSNGSKNAMLAREASETLRTVYTAQRLYLSDNPLVSVSSLGEKEETLILYLPNRATAMPTVKALNGSILKIKFTVFPPVIDNGTGGSYDPSGNSKDSLWDVGE
jgi:type II secretory pathway pseudopilin PulG